MMFNIRFILQIVVFKCLIVSGVAFASSYDDFFAAIKADNVGVLQNLQARGFDLNTRNADGLPGLVLALREGAVRSASYLIAAPAVDVEARSPKDESPLMMAALKGHTDLARALIARGAHVNKPGWTPLHYAATHSGPASAEMVQLMLEHHAYIDAESPNRTTPLMMAAHYGSEAAVRLLVEGGADLLVKNAQGLSAIDFAHRANRPAVAEIIAGEVRARRPKGTW